MSIQAKSPPPRSRLATLAVGAEHAGVSPKTLRRWIDAGLLPGYKLGPTRVRVSLDDLDLIVTPIPVSAPPQDAE